MESSWNLNSLINQGRSKFLMGIKNAKIANFNNLEFGVYFSMLLFKIWKTHSIFIVIIFRG